jgi:hypothetical protein
MRRIFTLLTAVLLIAACSATTGGTDGDASPGATNQASDASDAGRLEARDFMLADGWTSEEAECVSAAWPLPSSGSSPTSGSPTSGFGVTGHVVIVGWSADYTIALDMRLFDYCGIGLDRIAEVTCQVHPGEGCP